MDHLPWLIERSAETGGEPCGHALMASCPPEPFGELSTDIPFGQQQQQQQKQQYGNGSSSNPGSAVTPVSAGGHMGSTLNPSHVRSKSQNQQQAATGIKKEANPGQKTWELNKGDLSTLLDLSTRLNLDGEVTPVMAWGMVLGHPRARELAVVDFAQLAEVLKGKVRCYGFGAVMEEFEVRDAIENVLSTKPEQLLMPAYKGEQVAMAY